jgi:antirestriction protein
MKITMTETPKIYVACLASYNSGTLHGEWIDLDGTETLGERISQILKNSPVEHAEEWAVHDHEYCGNLSEYPGIQALNSVAEAFEQVSEKDIDWELYCEFCEHLGEDISVEILPNYEEVYAGSAETLVDWFHYHSQLRMPCI